MRIARLALTAFGPFSGAAIELAEARPEGVVDVVFGPNEAGKSTTLRAVSDLLFGFPHSTPDAHRHRSQDLQLGATLVGPAGERWAVVRTKGRKDTLRTETGEVADEAKLERWLGGIKREIFTRAYGLDHETLRRGAEELLAGEGDAAETLFAAALGRTGLLTLERELSAQAEAIFTVRGKNPLLNQALKAYKDAKSRSDGTDRRAWETQRALLDDLRAEQAKLVTDRDELIAERNHVDRLLRVLPVAKAIARHARVQADAIADLEQRLAQLPQDEAVAAVASRIAAVAERLPGLRRADLERPLTERTRASLASDVERVASGLGSEPRAEGALAAVTAALEPIEELDAQRRTLEAHVRDARAELALAGTHGAEAETLLRQALDRVRALGDAGAQRRKITASIASMQAEIAKRRAEIPWDPETRALPPAAAIAEHEQLLAQRSDAVGAARTELASIERELAAKVQQRDHLVAAGAPPTEGDVRAARDERDETWRAIVAGEKVHPVFEAKMRRADDLADALRAESKRSTLLATLDADIRAQGAAKERAERALAAAIDARRAADEAWRGLAQVDASPQVFRAYVALHEDLLRRASAVASESAALAEHDRIVGEATSALERACETKGDPDLVARAEARLTAIVDARAAAARLAKDASALAQATAEHDAARARARVALEAAGLPPDATPREAAALIARIQEADRARRSLADVDESLARSAADRSRVEAEVREIAAQLGVTITGDALDVADALVRRLAVESERAKERGRLEEELAAKRLERDREAQTLGEHRAEIAQAVAALGDKFADRGSDDANEAALDARRDAIEEATSALDDRLRRIVQDIGSNAAGLQQMEATSLAVEASAEAEAERAKIRDLALRYARLRAGAVLLRREMERYREANEAPVVKHAGEIFRRLTGGAFSALRVDHDEKDAPFLLAQRASGGSLPVSSLSEGTRDQLYLALRLATLHRTARATDPLPLVLDDVLVHFDDVRAAAALEVLGELSRELQVILFTHHEHVAKLATSTLGGRAAVHRIG